MVRIASGLEISALFKLLYLTLKGNNAASLVPSLDTEVDTPSTIEAVREWLQNCRCTGTSSEQKTFKPTRLLDIGEKEDQDHVTVIETLGNATSSYACLSYYWGGSQPVTNSILRKPSSDGWVIPLYELPETFKESIYTLRRLGFQYVWIDSLCIIQDDLDNKGREICEMPHIYKNSQLTLCASTAQSCDLGFLQPRPDHSENQLQLSMPNGKFGTLYLDRISWIFPPATEQLGTRAWAFQERFLSPRLLEYGWRTLRWSCSCSERYSGYQPLPSLADNNGDALPAPSYNLFGYLNPSGIRHITQ
jgi:hypothetical protein